MNETLETKSHLQFSQKIKMSDPILKRLNCSKQHCAVGGSLFCVQIYESKDTQDWILSLQI